MRNDEDVERLKEVLNKEDIVEVVVYSNSLGEVIEKLRDVILSNYRTTLRIWVKPWTS